MKRTGMRPRRREPRTRSAPRWSREEWDIANTMLAARAGLRCEWCGDPLTQGVERHHRQRRRDGGDRLSNIVLLHPVCHQWLTAHPAKARERGLIVSVYVPDPSTVPLFWQNLRWVLLGDDGTVVPAPTNSPSERLDGTPLTP